MQGKNNQRDFRLVFNLRIGILKLLRSKNEVLNIMKCKIKSELFFKIKSYGEYQKEQVIELGKPCIDNRCKDKQEGKCIGVLGAYCAIDLIKDGIIELIN